MNSLWISETGLRTSEKVIELISNNVANINTNSYKFQEAFLEELNNINQKNLSPSGVWISSINKNFKQGDLIATGNSFDIAIEGDGFFRILLPDDTIAYTRNGNFAVSKDGYLITKNGFKLFPEIVLPEDTVDFIISEYGDVFVKKSDGNIENIGSIEIANFINNDGLKSIGNGIYISNENTGEAQISNPGKDGNGILKQGFIEKSNVDLINEFIKMIIIQKSYEMNAKVIQTTDAMMSIANSIKR